MSAAMPPPPAASSTEEKSSPPDVDDSFGNNSGMGFDYRTTTGEGNSQSASGFNYRMEDEQNQTSSKPRGTSFDANDPHNNNNLSEFGIEIGYLPPDQRPGLPGELLNQLVDPEIDEDTEAAEALRANANVKVRKMGKVMRGVGAQSVRKLAKRVTMRGTSGNRRGKPPRIPPGLMASGAGATGDEGAFIFSVNEEGEFIDGEEDQDHSSLNSAGESSTQEHQHQHHADTTHDHHHQAVEPDHLSRPSTSQEDHHNTNANAAGTGTGAAKRVRIKDDGSVPSRAGDTDSKTKRDFRHSSILEVANDIPAEVVAATMEAGRKLMGALDPHNMLQLQRWRRRGKKGKKKRKSYVKGKVIDGRHELYTLSIAMMLGLRTSIARTNTIIASADRRSMLTPQDFMAEEKYEFAPKGSAMTPPHKLSHTFKFKDYAPVAFLYLRRMFGVNEFDFLLSVCGNANFIEFISNAKSGQFFFYSSDGKYMIKTMTNTECKFLRRILPHYYRHCTQNPNTLITKFLGMYRVKLYHLRRNVKFVVMNSVYYTDKSLQTFYDLKGSELGRSAKDGQEVLKDNDLRAKLPEEAICVPKHVQERLRAQIVSDCRFLRKVQIMDYSMLIGIHHVPPKEEVHKHGNIAETGLRIKDRQTSIRDSIRAQHHATTAAAAIRAEEANGGSHAAENNNGQQQPHEPFAPASSGREGLMEVNKLMHGSTKKLISDIRESTYSVSNFEFAGLLDEEDDCSYLEGSNEYKDYKKSLDQNQHPVRLDDDVEFKKEQTIEQIYWPFHRFYDINGLRRMKPKPCFRCNTNPCVCHSNLLKEWRIPDFVPSLSTRKDGGLTMDTNGLNLPMTFHGPQGDRPYEGKVFFMGIIDILQQYNARKRVETRYRKLEVKGGLEPSCVSPEEYAARFISFFDEYSTRTPKTPKAKNPNEEEKTEVEVSIRKTDGDAKNKDVKIDVSSTPNGYRRGEPKKPPPGTSNAKPAPPKGRFVVT